MNNKYYNKIISLSKSDNWYNMAKCDILFYAPEGAHYSFKNNGLKYSKFIDPIIDYYKSKNLKTIKILAPYSNVFNLLHNEGVRISRGHFLKTISGGFFYDKMYLNYYIKIIKSLQPSFIIALSPTKYIINAAKECNIKIVEISHGIGYSKDNLKQYYGEYLRFNLPDIFISTDETTTREIKKFTNDEIEIIPFCHPNYKVVQKEFTEKKSILYSCQWGLDGEMKSENDTLKNGIIPESILEIIIEYPEYNWIVRPHPIQLSKAYPKTISFFKELEIKNSNVNVTFDLNKLYNELSKVDLHITMHSMLSYECAWSGIQTIALSPLLNNGTLSHMFEDLVDENYLKKINFNEKAKIAEKVLSSKRLIPREYDYKANDLESLLDYLYDRFYRHKL